MQRRRIIQLFGAVAADLFARRAMASAFQNPLLPLFPLEAVLLPHTVLPLYIFEERYKEMIQDCLRNRSEFGIVLTADQAVKQIGCTASVDQVIERFPDGRMNILVRGGQRFSFSELDENKSYFRGDADFIADASEPAASEEVRTEVVRLAKRLRELAHSDIESFQDALPSMNDEQLSYRLVAGLPAELDWQQTLLEERSERERLTLVTEFLQATIQRFERGQAPRSII